MAIQTALPAVIRLILGDESADVTWKNREAGFRADSNVRLSIVSRPRRGVDETRYADPAVDGSMVERVYGVRRLTVQVQVETQDQDYTASAADRAETIRTGFHRSDVEALLDAEDLGGVQTQDVRVVDYKDAHGRWRSAAVFEVWFNTHTTHVGPTVDTVGSVEVTGTVDAVAQAPVTVDEDD